MSVFVSNMCMAGVMSLTVFRKYELIGITPKRIAESPTAKEVEVEPSSYIQEQSSFETD